MTSAPQNKQPLQNKIGNTSKCANKPFGLTSATQTNQLQNTIGNIANCGNKPSKAPAKKKSMAELLSVPTQTSQAIPKSPTTRSMTEAKKKAKSPVTRSMTQARPKRKAAPYGVGVYTCLSTGDNYYKSLGSKKGKWITNRPKPTNQGSSTQCLGSSNAASSNPVRRTLNLGGLNLGS